MGFLKGMFESSIPKLSFLCLTGQHSIHEYRLKRLLYQFHGSSRSLTTVVTSRLINVTVFKQMRPLFYSIMNDIMKIMNNIMYNIIYNIMNDIMNNIISNIINNKE